MCTPRGTFKVVTNGILCACLCANPLVVSLGLATTPARPQIALATAVRAFETADFRKAATAFWDVAADSLGVEPAERSLALMYLGSSLLVLQDDAGADRAFRRLLAADWTYQPDAAIFRPDWCKRLKRLRRDALPGRFPRCSSPERQAEFDARRALVVGGPNSGDVRGVEVWEGYQQYAASRDQVYAQARIPGAGVVVAGKQCADGLSALYALGREDRARVEGGSIIRGLAAYEDAVRARAEWDRCRGWNSAGTGIITAGLIAMPVGLVLMAAAGNAGTKEDPEFKNRSLGNTGAGLLVGGIALSLLVGGPMLSHADKCRGGGAVEPRIPVRPAPPFNREQVESWCDQYNRSLFAQIETASGLYE